MTKEEYNEAAMNHLNDCTTYRKTPRMTAKTMERKMNTTWKEICCKRNIPKRIQQSYIASNTELPRFYDLIKTHKLQGVKIRPIVSNRNGPTTRISWLLARLLKPRLKDAPAHLNKSLDLILDIQAKDKPAHQRYPYPFSLDVVSLYTSIPVSDAIACVTDEIHTSSYGLTREDIKDLLMIVLHNTYFQYESSIHLQVQRLSMGSSLSGILAILFMDKLEKKALFSCLYIDPYKRYGG